MGDNEGSQVMLDHVMMRRIMHYNFIQLLLIMCWLQPSLSYMYQVVFGCVFSHFMIFASRGGPSPCLAGSPENELALHSPQPAIHMEIHPPLTKEQG